MRNYENEGEAMSVLASKDTQNLVFWQERYNEAKEKKRDILTAIGIGFDWDLIDSIHKKIVDQHIGKNEKVLDVGCGIGRNAAWFKDECYHGIDFVPEFIDEARKAHPKKEFSVVNIVDVPLPFPDGSFDWALLISCKVVIAPVVGEEKWNAVEKELKRVAKNVIILDYANSDPEEAKKCEIL